MPRQFQPVEFNTFIGGLVTEASPLTFPNNASLDEENFVLNKDGSRSRRLGMQYEAGGSIVTSAQTLNPQGQLVAGSFKWSNAGGLSTNTVICVQIGSSIDFFQGNATAISSSKFYTYTFSNMPNPNRFSYASVDGKLIVATGNKEITIFSFDNNQVDITKAITVETKRLLIRDLFGLDCLYSDGRNLREGSDISFRPAFSQVGPPHIYNLRNQGWAIPHSQWNGNDFVADTIIQFSNNSKTVYPSNADNITSYLYANTNDSGGTKTITRFDAENLVVNAPVNTYSPIGYFIIDALDRNASRRAVINDMQNKFPQNDANLYQQALAALTTDDSTPTGATVVCEFAGRIFYAGFSGEVIGGDQHSPKMSSYILFSQLVRDSSGVNRCYQAADPTDPSSSDLVDTDGGFLRIEGAYGIIGMAVLQSTLFVFAHNGVWSITGGSGSGFTATNYNSAKLTNSGCISTGSIVPMQDSIFYWGLDGIYAITRNQFGDFKSENITNKTIKRFYMSIPDASIRNAEGVYSSYDSAVKWVYNNYIGATDDPIELNLDVITGAYYRHRIKSMTGSFPLLIRGIQTDPYRISTTQNNVVVGVDSVLTADNSQVVVNNSQMVQGVKEVVYFILTGSTSGIQYTFGNYNQAYHYDWTDVDGVGIDSPAYLLTGVLSGGDYQRDKQIVYQTTHFSKTEVPIKTVSLTSRPYPLDPTDSMSVSGIPNNGTLKQTVYGINDKFSVSVTPLTGALRASLSAYVMKPDGVYTSASLTGGLMKSVFKSYRMGADSVVTSASLLSGGGLTTQLIRYQNWPAEGVSVSMSPQGGSLVTTNDPYYANVVSLLHFDGTNGSTTFTDGISSNTWVRNGTSTISTTDYKFGSASGNFPSNTISPIQTTDKTSLQMGSSDFTIEGWFNPLAPPGGFGLWYCKGLNTSGGIQLGVTPTSVFLRCNTTTDKTISTTISGWTHIAWVRSSGTTTFYVNGTSVGNTTTVFNNNDTSDLYIGSAATGSVNGTFSYCGYLDEVRVTKGVARYTTNFTPPTMAFPNQ